MRDQACDNGCAAVLYQCSKFSHTLNSSLRSPRLYVSTIEHIEQLPCAMGSSR